MDDNNPSVVWDNTIKENTFSVSRQEEPSILPIESNRINTGLYLASYRMTELKNTDEKAILIFKLLRLFLTTKEFRRGKNRSRQNILNPIHYFVLWLNNKKNITNKVVNQFESEQVKSKSILPSSTGASEILFCLEAATRLVKLDSQESRFINHLITKSRLVGRAEDKPDQVTMSRYFLEHGWIENEMGNAQFLKLASTKRLIESFKIVIATSLTYLSAARKQLNTIPSIAHELPNRNLDQYELNTYLQAYLNKHFALDEAGEISTHLSNVLLIDMVTTPKQTKALDKLRQGKSVPIKDHLSLQVFIRSCEISEISTVEQYLMAFLCASFCVQPEDIFKLKRKHFAVQKNSLNQPRYITLDYFKGRSGGMHDVPLLTISKPAGKAFYDYLNDLSPEINDLFEKPMGILKLSCYSKHARSNQNSIVSFLISLWQSEHFKSIVLPKLKVEKASTLFLDCISALASPDAQPFSAWKRSNDGRYEDYLKEVKYSRPIYIFWLAQIKNSAVHSKSDQYKEKDIKNSDSHTPLTTKTRYLNKDNPEWMNQLGRITRAVMTDMESCVMKPNISQIEAKAHDKMIRTHIVDVTGNNDLSVRPLAHEQSENIQFDFDDITVLKTKDTVMQMLHYIAQADKFAESLMGKNPDFFYHTVLVKVEWMKHVLSEKFDPSSTEYLAGYDTYQRIKKYLPDLFSNELNGGVS